MERQMTFWMCLLVVLYIWNLQSVNGNLREKFTINGNDLKKIKLIKEDLDEIKNSLGDQKIKRYSCPLAEDIAPCYCTLEDYTNELSLNCDHVESEQQLAAVFQKHFPFKNFKTFIINDNRNIEHLHDIFNGVTFEYIELYYVYNLKFISEYFLLGSVDTLKKIFINNAPNLTTECFPFATMGRYSNLWELTFYSVLNGVIPKIQSKSLTDVIFLLNDITSLEPGFLAGAPNVNTFAITYSKISTLSNGTFAIPDQDTWIYAYWNEYLQSIQPGAFYFANEASLKSTFEVRYYFRQNDLVQLETGLLKLRNGYTYICFRENFIMIIEKGAFELPAITDNLSIEIDLHFNSLTTIDELVFGELMPFISILNLSDNPLTCGCDIFWLISNPDYRKVLDSSNARCVNGTLVADLDVQQYQELCT